MTTRVYTHNLRVRHYYSATQNINQAQLWDDLGWPSFIGVFMWLVIPGALMTFKAIGIGAAMLIGLNHGVAVAIFISRVQVLHMSSNLMIGTIFEMICYMWQ